MKRPDPFINALGIASAITFTITHLGLFASLFGLGAKEQWIYGGFVTGCISAAVILGYWWSSSAPSEFFPQEVKDAKKKSKN